MACGDDDNTPGYDEWACDVLPGDDNNGAEVARLKWLLPKLLQHRM
jgi:hypothetical protein